MTTTQGETPTDAAADPATGVEVLDLDRAHVFHSWSAQRTLTPLPIARTEGTAVWDYDGRRYLDFSSQLVYTNVGHQHPRVVAAIQEQAGRMCTIAPQHANDVRGQAAQRITARTPAGLDWVFFTSTGAEAVENAIRMARLHTGRRKIISTYRSYHGNTAAAIVATGDPRRWPNDVGIAGHVHVFGPFPYRSPFWSADDAEECERALSHLRQVIEFEGPETVAAILLESVPGTAGVIPPPPGFLDGVRQLCDEFGILWIADEVMAGFGRTGSWFAFQHWGAVPDLISFAKGVNSGYVPLGGVILSQAVYESFLDRPYPGGSTYSGHPLACAAAVATLDAMEEEGMIEHARKLGEDVVRPGLQELADRHPVVGQVRGLGMFWALDLVRDRSSRQMLVPYNASGAANAPMAELAAACRRRGLLAITSQNRLHLVPPCNVSVDELTEALGAVDDALGEIDHYYTGAP
ncbi:aminotransferase class III-fold pyridoxal phosphate-dependent enzyme [Acidimicrobiaceae bacterium USS-CC1]|uniref:Aminotransferase class III-fold pyridoxal phosphate-dependent enzyme n=1 Tax=Acidiferrimicrobium australe TaxID=2664430 RepID=A0ABW9QST8_9ACTN|nr:aminotransferase class III-fold pyridoxal phosphate-dependent enzyme [Acidiferrimicrobium australe]